MNLKPHLSPGRLKEIVAVLLKYGFDEAVDHLHLPGKHTVRKLIRLPDGLTPYERIRMAFDELGPTFVKFGQVLSLRSDLLPKPLVAELEKLQDKSKPLAYETIAPVLSRHLPQPPEALFARIDETPLASASLSQVHRAVIKSDGRVVALKIQRPHIRADIERDLDIFAFIARQLHQHMESLQVYDLPAQVALLRRSLRRELNFLIEARNLQIARQQMESLSGLCIPTVLRLLSSEKVLVMDFIEGTRPGNGRPEPAAALASLGLAAAVKQILENGFFHADPHPGNVLVAGPETLCLLDWGMVGRLTPGDREKMIELIGAIVDRDSDSLADAILSISGKPAGLDRRALQIDLMELLDLHIATALEDMRLATLLLGISDLIRDHRLRVPPDLYLMFKALVSAEASARLLNPQLDIISELRPQIERLAMARFHPSKLMHRLRATLIKVISSPGRFPHQVAEVVDIIRRGELSLRFEHHNLEPLLSTLEKTFSRLTLGIISAAMIIGSSLILVTKLPPMLGDYSLLGLAGYLLSALVGFWVVYDILRNR